MIRYLLFVLVSTSPLWTTGCTTTSQRIDGTSSQPTTDISFSVVKSIAAGPLAIAMDQGFFEKEGLNISVHYMAGGDEAFKALVSNSVDIGLIGIVPYAFVALESPEVKLFSVITESHDNQLLLRTDQQELQGDDLKGMTIGYKKTTASEIGLQKVLENYGLTFDDITAIDISPAGMPAALLNGDIDGYSIWEPTIYNGKNLLSGNTYVFDSMDDTYTRYISLFGKETFLRENPEVVKKILTAFQKAKQFMMSQPQESKQIVSEFSALPLEVVDAIREKYVIVVDLKPEYYSEIDSLLQRANPKRSVPQSTIPSSSDLVFELSNDISKK